MSSWKHVSTRRKVAKFSSRSLGSYAGSERTIHRPGNSYFGFGNQDALGLSVNALVMNSSLLEPLQLDLDPNIRTIKVQEKEQIKTLNDRFACFINKNNSIIRSDDLSDIAERNLKIILLYEEEINKRYKAEDDFVSVKKDVDAGYFDRINLEEEWSEIRLELDFFKALYAEEVRELKEQLKDTSVVVEMDNSRQLNMEQVVKHLKSQNEEVSARSRQEAEAWYQKKCELESSHVEPHSSELKSTKSEIRELMRLISKLQAVIRMVKAECKSTDGRMDEAKHRGEGAVFEAKQKLKELEEALVKAKQDMARQVCKHQDMMNIKLGLDIEIATYKKLLEGEENRTARESVIRVQSVTEPSYPEPVGIITCTSVLIKMVDTQNKSIISAKD